MNPSSLRRFQIRPGRVDSKRLRAALNVLLAACQPAARRAGVGHARDDLPGLAAGAVDAAEWGEGSPIGSIMFTAHAGHGS